MQVHPFKVKHPPCPDPYLKVPYLFSQAFPTDVTVVTRPTTSTTLELSSLNMPRFSTRINHWYAKSRELMSNSALGLVFLDDNQVGSISTTIGSDDIHSILFAHLT